MAGLTALYQPVAEAALRNGLPVLAGNPDPAGTEGPLGRPAGEPVRGTGP